mmetsp:Transcript_14910/g.42995  ORF Transcript_14910/g.42995 Transcript_14910/m.42995 type:complete len:228 (+) Transcript_14910:495-1178(+)
MPSGAQVPQLPVLPTRTPAPLGRILGPPHRGRIRKPIGGSRVGTSPAQPTVQLRRRLRCLPPPPAKTLGRASTTAFGTRHRRPPRISIRNDRSGRKCSRTIRIGTFRRMLCRARARMSRTPTRSGSSAVSKPRKASTSASTIMCRAIFLGRSMRASPPCRALIRCSSCSRSNCQTSWCGTSSVAATSTRRQYKSTPYPLRSPDGTSCVVRRPAAGRRLHFSSPRSRA